MPELPRHLATVATFILLTATAWAAGVLELLQREDAPPAEELCAAAQAPSAPPTSVDGPVWVSARCETPLHVPASALRQSAA